MAFKLKYLNPVRWVKKGAGAIGGAVKGAKKKVSGFVEDVGQKAKKAALGTPDTTKVEKHKMGEKWQREIPKAAAGPAKEAIEQLKPFEFPSELVRQLSQEYKPGEIDYAGFKPTEDAAVKLLQEQLIPKLASQWSAMGVNPYGDPTFELQKNKLIQDTLAGLAQERSIFGERQQLLGMKGYEQNLSRAQQLANLLQNQQAIQQNRAGFLRETAMTPVSQNVVKKVPGQKGLLDYAIDIGVPLATAYMGMPAVSPGLTKDKGKGQDKEGVTPEGPVKSEAPQPTPQAPMADMAPRTSTIMDLLNQSITGQYEKPGVAASTDMNPYNINQILGQQALQELKGPGRQRKPSVLGGGKQQQQPMYPSAQSGLAALGYGGQF